MVRTNVLIGNGASAVTVVVALFRDATANALNAEAETMAANDVSTILAETITAAGSISATTFRLRVGTSTSTIRINGIAGAQLFSTMPKTWIEVFEIKA